MFQILNIVVPEKTDFGQLEFEFWSLFRISIFEFRIFNSIVARLPDVTPLRLAQPCYCEGPGWSWRER